MSTQLLFTMIVFNSLVVFLPIAAILLWLKPNLWLPLLTAFLGILIVSVVAWLLTKILTLGPKVRSKHV